MSDRGKAPDTSTSAEDTELSGRLHDLNRRLQQRRVDHREKTAEKAVPRNAGFAMAFRVASDLIGGVIVGAALGWGFDRLFGTSPWGLSVLLLLGFAAGLRNVIKSTDLRGSSTGGADQSRNGK